VIAPGYTTDLEHCVKISGVSRGDGVIAPGYTTDLGLTVNFRIIFALFFVNFTIEP